jgi:PPP family 3-phenylpropionic acid transporter
VGVGAEVALMAVSHRVLARLGAERLLVLALATAAARWLALGQAHTGWAILLLQPLHGVTFGLNYVAAVTLMRQEGAEVPSAAQGLFTGALGLGSVVGLAFAGHVLDRWGGMALYSGAAGVAVLATALAALYERSRARPAARLPARSADGG